MTDSTLVFTSEADGRPAVVCNFGVHAGREATRAELDRLGGLLLHEIEPVDVVSEHRHRFDRERSAAVYQVRVELPPDVDPVRLPLVSGTVEDWARDCLADRRLVSP
jgi:hypothetical protein